MWKLKCYSHIREHFKILDRTQQDSTFIMDLHLEGLFYLLSIDFRLDHKLHNFHIHI